MRLPLLFCLALVASSLAPTAFPQPPQSSADKPLKHSRAQRHACWAKLTEDERAKLRAAHQKAMADPSVKAAHERLKQARREFRDVMGPAMLRADPSIQPLLDKLLAERD
jgi:Spy/CpxP family protein refolding chaperone